ERRRPEAGLGGLVDDPPVVEPVGGGELLRRDRRVRHQSAASASASERLGWTRRLSTMSSTLSPAVTARAITEMSSAAWRPTIDPPSTTPVAGSETIFTKPRGALLMRALAVVENGTLVTRILRPSANASASARPTSAISGSVKIAEAALS